MSAVSRLLLIAVIAAGVFLVHGCAGMPGAGGGQQNMPPGVLPPPGLESGGARTLMGTTITAPDGYFLLVRRAPAESDMESPWQSCRRIIVLETSLLVEGINYDGRATQTETDYNEVVPFSKIESFDWKYEAKPSPEPEAESEGGKSEGKD